MPSGAKSCLVEENFVVKIVVPRSTSQILIPLAEKKTKEKTIVSTSSFGGFFSGACNLKGPIRGNYST